MHTPQEILQLIKSQKKSKSTFILGIDGPGGTGKTTLASKLSVLDSAIEVVHMDDFDLPTNGKITGNPNEKAIGEDTDWERMRIEVIKPLRSQKTSSYLPFDREKGKFGKLRLIKPGGIVVVEGVFAIRRELAKDYDLTIWLSCEKDIRFKRVLQRDGEKTRERWEKDWIPMELRYEEEHNPAKYADLVIKTSTGNKF